MKITWPLAARKSVKCWRPKFCFTDKEHEVQFRPTLPLKLQDTVSTSNQRMTGSNCIQEMYNMLACMKKSEFEQSDCSKEIQLFKKCNAYKEKTVEFQQTSKKDRKINPQRGEKRMSTRELNNFLRKFPT